MKKRNKPNCTLEEQKKMVLKANDRWLNSNGPRSNSLDHPWSQEKHPYPRNVDLIDSI